jgi:hypothetical protein
VYLQKVEQYTERKSSDYRDVFWAFVGTLKGLKDRFPNGYLWGMPKDQLDAALLWQKCCIGNFSEGHILESGDGTWCRLPIPSWSWIAKGYQVQYGEFPGSALVPRVVWHEPIRYTGNYDLSTTSANLTQDSTLSIFAGSNVSGLEPGLIDFALLHFTAETASLTLHIGPRNPELEFPNLRSARILLPGGEEFGEIIINGSNSHSSCDKIKGDFIPLSINTGERGPEDIYVDGMPVHAPPLEPVPHANIMLVEWHRTPKGSSYAVRLGLAQIAVSDWDALETTKKEIILG